MVGVGQITVGEYLLERLHDAGCHDIFGVPGDFVLGFFNQIEKSKIHYVGTCNELNAAYAADAYARIKGIGALSTTYNVGELSALNGVAGSFAENVPVVKITGCPARQYYRSSALLHHTLVDYNVAVDMFAKVTADYCVLDNPATAARDIDRVLTACLTKKLPVYIGLPADVVSELIPRPTLPFRIPSAPVSDPDTLHEAVAEIVSVLQQSKTPILIPGVEIARHNLRGEFRFLLEQSRYPYTTMLLSKTCLNEHHPQYIGLYCGDRSREYVRNRVETSDAIVIFGEKLTDFNTGGFTALLDTKKTINIAYDHVRVSHHTYPRVFLHDVIRELSKRIPPKNPATLNIHCASDGCVHRRNLAFEPKPTAELTMARFFDRMVHFIKPNSNVIAETGSSLFAAAEVQMPAGTTFFSQTFYGSIGYTVGATLGTSIAAPNKTSYLFIGDGSFQVTFQDLSTMIRYGCKPIIFLINNDGYTIERVIVDHKYDDIQMWQYHKIPQIMGGGVSFDCKTEADLEVALKKAEEVQGKELVFIEVHFDRMDCNEALKRAGAAMARSNKLI